MAGQTVSTDNIFKEFKEYSAAEFFKKNRQMLGFTGPIRSMTTIIHEYVTNSIDACEAAGILPELIVKIDKFGPDSFEIMVQDNGPGMPDKIVGRALGQLLAGTKFHGNKQSRGQQGIGASYCTIYSQITTGKPTHVLSGTDLGKVTEMDVSVDVKKNAPKIENKKTYKSDFRGTKIIAKFKEVQYTKGANGPLEYLRRTAIANPHCEIKFYDPEGARITFLEAAGKFQN